MRKRIFLAVSTSDLATRNRTFFPPCRIRSTALKAEKGWGRCRRALRVRTHCRSGGQSLLEVLGGDPTPHPPAVTPSGQLQSATLSPPCCDRASGSRSLRSGGLVQSPPHPKVPEPLRGLVCHQRANAAEGREVAIGSQAGRLCLHLLSSNVPRLDVASHRPRGGGGGRGGHGGQGAVPQVADAHQAAAVHLQDAVSQRQPPVGGCGAPREQGLDVEPWGAQGCVLGEKRKPQSSVGPSHTGVSRQGHLRPSPGLARWGSLYGRQCVFKDSAGHHQSPRRPRTDAMRPEGAGGGSSC